jgi:exo beta-1,2-glucooligosaccharide sophorohydrolase (non-reducing end)
MIENHRTGLIWRNYMANPEIAPMLHAIGFRSDNTTQ